MSQTDLDNRVRLAKFFESLAHPARIAILLNLGKVSLQEIASTIGSNPPALQRHVNTLRDAGLIEKYKRTYRLTDSGKHVVKMFAQFEDVVSRLKEKEKDLAKQKIKAVFIGSGLSKDDVVTLLEDLRKGRKNEG